MRNNQVTIQHEGETFTVSTYAIGKALGRDQDGGRKLAAILGHMSNGCFGNPGKVGRQIAEGIVEDHRTLQQIVIGTLFATINAIGDFASDMRRYTDLRNADSFEACKQVRELTEDGKINRYFPLI